LASGNDLTPPGNTGTESRTYAFWAYLNNGGGVLFSKHDAALGPSYISSAFRVTWEGGTSGLITLDIGRGDAAGGGFKSCSVDDVAWHAWHFIVITIGAVNQISVDGSEWASQTANMIPRADHADVPLVIGGSAYDTLGTSETVRDTNSLLDHLTLFNRALTLEEVLWLYNSGAGRDFPTYPAPELTLLDGLVAYWKMEEATAADRLDATGNGNTLEDSSGINTVAGKIGNAGLFGGSNFLEISDRPAITPGMGSFSIALWVKFGANWTQGVFNKWSSGAGNKEYCLYYGLVPFQLNFIVTNNGGSDNQLDNGYTVATDQWHFVVCVYDHDAGLIKMSVDGNAFVTKAHTGGIWDGSSPLYFGRDQGGGFMTGALDEIGYWNRALTMDEVTTLHNNPNGITYPFS